MTCLAAVHAVLPPHRYPQDKITEAFAEHVLGDGGPATRCCAGSTPTPGWAAATWRCRSISYRQLTDFTAANNAYLEVAVDLGVAGGQRRACRPPGSPRTGRRHLLHHRHRPGGAVAGGQDRTPGRASARTSNGCRCSASAASPARPASPGCTTTSAAGPTRRHPAVRRTVLADGAARRHLDGQPGGQRAVRRRRGRRGRGGCRPGRSVRRRRTAGARHPQPPVPGHRGGDGVEHRHATVSGSC